MIHKAARGLLSVLVLLAAPLTAGDTTAAVDWQTLTLTGQLGDGAFAHCDSVTAIVQLSDGRRVLTSSRDHSARLWDLNTGKELRRYVASAEDVWGLSVLPGEKTMLTCTGDNRVVLWEIESGRQLKEFKAEITGTNDDVFRVAALPDGKQFVSVMRKGMVLLWNIETGKYRKLEGLSNDVYGLAVLPDGALIAAGSSESKVMLWQTASEEKGTALAEHKGEVRTLAFSNDGQRLACVAADGTLEMWNVSDRKQLWTKALDRSTVLAFSAKGDSLAVTQNEKTVRIIDAASGNETAKFETRSTHWPVVFSPDGKRVLSASFGLQQWDLEAGKWLFPPLHGHQDGVRAAVIVPGGETLVSVGDDGVVHLWNLRTRVEKTRWEFGRELRAVDVSPDGKQVLAGGYEKVCIWQTATAGEPKEITTDVRNGARFSLDGKRIICADGKQFDTEQGTQIRDEVAFPSDDTSNSANEMALTPNRLHAAMGYDDGAVRIWNLVSGERLAKFQMIKSGDRNDVEAVAFSADGRLLLAGAETGQVTAWRSGSAQAVVSERLTQLLKDLTADDFDVRVKATAALIECGDRVLPALTALDMGDPEVVMRVKQIQTGIARQNLPSQQITESAELGGRVHAVAVHPDGKHWAAAVKNGVHAELVLGEITPAKVVVQRTIADGRGANGLCFSANGNTLYVTNGDSTISIYELGK